jgi:two-component system OmpR family sensor kinase
VTEPRHAAESRKGTVTEPRHAAESREGTVSDSHRGGWRPWGLEGRLVVTIVAVVALIFATVSIATGAILGSILQSNLDNEVTEATAKALRTVHDAPQVAAGTEDAAALLASGPFEPGFLIVIESAFGSVTGGYVDAAGTVTTLEDSQVDQIVQQLIQPGEGGPVREITIDGVGTYRMVALGGGSFAIASGLPVSQVTATLAQIATTVALLTAGGLVLLGLAVTVIVRRSLRPLRVVADTAERVASVPMAEGEVSIADRVPASETDERTEIGRVGHALNTLLDHVDASLEARQRNEERMRRFVADASHELRTPLASIRGYSELSLRDPQLSETTESALSRIQAQSLRMTRLVEDLLLLARLDEGQELVYGVVDLTQLAVEALGDAQVAGPEHVWLLDVDEEPVTVPGDSARLQQVVVNMLANARTHTPAGTEVTLSVGREASPTESESGADDAVIRVHDNGPGIEPAIADELFERFSRADRSRARQTGGTGLGLSIARAIVHAHHGEISVESRPGDTTFTVRLPLPTHADRSDPATGAVQ